MKSKSRDKLSKAMTIIFGVVGDEKGNLAALNYLTDAYNLLGKARAAT